jgi:hypothetical protein
MKIGVMFQELAISFGLIVLLPLTIVQCFSYGLELYNPHENIFSQEQMALLDKSEQQGYFNLNEDERSDVSDMTNKVNNHKRNIKSFGEVGVGIITILIGFFLFSGIISAGVIIGGIISILVGYLHIIWLISSLAQLLIALAVLGLFVFLAIIMRSKRA